jgi:hypothetical protein
LVRFPSSIRALRSAFAVILAAFLMVSSVLTTASHAMASHDRTTTMPYSTSEKSAETKADTCGKTASVEDINFDQNDQKGHSGDQNAVDCSCICNPSGQPADGSKWIADDLGSKLVLIRRDVFFSSIVTDIDNPPIIRILS